MNTRKWIGTMAVFILPLAGCGSASTPNATKGGAAASNAVSNMQNRMHAAPQQIHSEKMVAQKLVQSGAVREASVLMVGKTAYVAVEMKPGHTNTLSSSVKSHLVGIVKQATPQVDTVYVSASPDVFSHFQKISRDIGAGRPISGVWENFRSMVLSVWPSAR